MPLQWDPYEGNWVEDDGFDPGAYDSLDNYGYSTAAQNPIYSPGLGGSIGYPGTNFAGEGQGNNSYDLGGNLTFGAQGTGSYDDQYPDSDYGADGGLFTYNGGPGVQSDTGGSDDGSVFTPDSGIPTFSATGTGQSSGLLPAQGGTISGIPRNPTKTPTITDPIPIGTTYPGAPSSTTNNNTTNKSANVSQTNLISESDQNNLPPIPNSVPESNPTAFSKQSSVPRSMNPAGMDSGARMPGGDYSSIQSPPYDPGLSRSGNDLPVGGGKTIPVTQPTSIKANIRDSLLGLTGVNRYRRMIQDARRRPTF